MWGKAEEKTENASVCVSGRECWDLKWCSDWSRMTTIAGTDCPSVLDAVVYVPRCYLSEAKRNEKTGCHRYYPVTSRYVSHYLCIILLPPDLRFEEELTFSTLVNLAKIGASSHNCSSNLCIGTYHYHGFIWHNDNLIRGHYDNPIFSLH